MGEPLCIAQAMPLAVKPVDIADHSPVDISIRATLFADTGVATALLPMVVKLPVA